MPSSSLPSISSQLPWSIRDYFHNNPLSTGYSVRALLTGLESTEENFVHLRPQSDSSRMEYNLDAHPYNPSTDDNLPGYTLRDCSQIVFPIQNLDESSTEPSKGYLRSDSSLPSRTRHLSWEIRYYLCNIHLSRWYSVRALLTLDLNQQGYTLSICGQISTAAT